MAPRVCAGLWSAPLFPRSMRVMTQRARMCRANETLSEALLWDELRDRRFQGTKWRRQQKMGRFVVDFFCSEHLLVVEVDGSVHRGRAEVDAQRQRALELTGVRFVRFSATEVERDVRAVLAACVNFSTPPLPLWERGDACDASDAWGGEGRAESCAHQPLTPMGRGGGVA